MAAELLADTYVSGDTLDVRDVIVALPGGRAGRRLKELLVREAERRGVRLVPPTVTTVGGLPELLHTPERRIADAQISRRIWIDVLRKAAGDNLAVVFPRLPDQRDLRGWFALADEVKRLHEGVGAAGRTFHDVIACCSGGLLFDDSARWTVLADLQDAYRNALAAHDLVDREFARIAAIREGMIECARDLWLVGVAEMSNVLREMLARIRPQERLQILVHAPDESADRFDAFGCVVPEAWTRVEVPLRDDQLEIVGNPSNQAAAAAQFLARLDGAYAADEIVIGVPDTEVVPYLEQQLATHGINARYAAGTPLTRTPAVRLLDAFAELMQDESADALAALARHPEFGEWLRRHRWQVQHPGAAAFRESDGWLVDLDTFIGERLPVSLVQELGGAGGRGRTVVEAMRVALLDDDLLGELRGTRRLREWLPRILNLVLAIYGDAPRSRDIPAERSLLEAAQALRHAALAHLTVPDELDHEACDVATAIRILLDDIRGGTMPAEVGEDAIELLGWLELHLDDAAVAVLTGMNEPFVPEAVNADPFLPDALRSRLGIEDNDRRYARDVYHLTAMLHSRRVHALAGRRTITGDPLRPSRLVLATSGAPLARRLKHFLAETTAGVVVAANARLAKSLFRLPPEPIIRLNDVPASFYVTDFRSLLEDPYAWALQRRIGNKPVEDAARELDPLRFGSLAHEVLERFGRSDTAASAEEREIAVAFERILDDYVAEHFGATMPAVRLQVEQLRMRLQAFAREQARRVADGWRTIGIECSTPENGVPFDVDGVEVRLRGRIDRIDYHESRNEWAVFDYKSSERPMKPEDAHYRKGKQETEWCDLQLPLYRLILPYVEDAEKNRVFTGASDATVSLGYAQLCADPRAIGFVGGVWDDPTLDEAWECARNMVRIVRANKFEFPGLDRNGWFTDDMAALLGMGRLVLEEEELEEEAMP